MIIDSHCHAWDYWPYQPPVPDPESRGRVDQLLHEMDLNEVDQALVVCAQIEHNSNNNAYVAEQVARYPSRLYQVADLDSVWSSTYQAPGGARRLRQMAEFWPLSGFTHYIDRQEDGSWLRGEEGRAIFQTAADLKLFASLSCYPHQLPAIRDVASRFPQVPVLLHHLGHPALGSGSLRDNLAQILRSAEVPNIYIKLSGFAYAAERRWDFPYPVVLEMVKAEYDIFGPRRMCWGSDYPVVRFYMTYQQSLEAFRYHCSFIPQDEQACILGNNLAALLDVNTKDDDLC
jgi:L-fuconolactonase